MQNSAFVLLVPIKKLDEFCDCIRRFQELYAGSSYFSEEYSGVVFKQTDRFIQEIWNHFDAQKRELIRSSEERVALYCSGWGGELFFDCRFGCLEYWSEKYGCLPVCVSGDFSDRGVTSLLKEKNRNLFYAILDIFPITLGFYTSDESVFSDDGYPKMIKLYDEDHIFLDRILFLGEEIFRFVDEYFVEETEFFFKKKIGPQKYLLSGYSLFFFGKDNDLLQSQFADGELNQTDFLYRSDEKRLKAWEEERLKLLGIPRKIPDYKDWDSVQDTNK
jgi:hypothetical protein